MKAFFIRFLVMMMLSGALLSPLKGVSFACSPEDRHPSMQLAAVELPRLTPEPPAEHRFVLVPSAVPCLVAIAATSVQHEDRTANGVSPAPAQEDRLAGTVVSPSHGPPILS